MPVGSRTLATALALVVTVATGCSSSRSGAGSQPSAPAAAATSAASSTTPAAPSSSTTRTASAPAPGTASRTTTRVTPAHVVIVVEENRSLADITHSAAAPYLRTLARGGARFTHYRAITHPSQPNYVALFSGSTHGLTDDSCPHTYGGNNLGRQLLDTRRTFAGYSEGLPRTGSPVCSLGKYARKHAPWVDFRDLPASVNRPLTALPSNYDRLPTLSFVIPDLDHDMHDGTIGQADRWLHSHLGRYATWARTHNSLLIVTWDEDDQSQHNRIDTVLTGARVRPGTYSETADHYRLLRTLEWMYGLHPLGRAAARTPITDVWTR